MPLPLPLLLLLLRQHVASFAQAFWLEAYVVTRNPVATCASTSPMQCQRICHVLAWIAASWGGAWASTEMPSKPDKLQRDFHNVFVFGILGLVAAWIAKVVYQLVRAVELNVRLSRARSLQLEAMSIYVNDFQMLIRQHFNQILRLRRTVPPKLVTRHELTTHVHPESISCLWVGEEDSGGGPMGFGVEFDIDASAPCCVRLYWGLSAQACNEFVQRSQAPEQSSRRQGGSTSSALRNLRGRWAGRTAYANPETTRSLLEMEELGGSAASGSAESSGTTWTAQSATNEANEDPPFSSSSCFRAAVKERKLSYYHGVYIYI